MATGDWFVNSSLIGSFEIDFLGETQNSPSCSGAVYQATLSNYGTSGVSISMRQVYGSYELVISSANPNIHTGIGWFNGNRIFANFVDTSDSVNVKTTLLKGIVSAGCLSASGTWESHIFGSAVSLATGTW